MSLQHLAEHIRQHGRGEDTMLIHMTPKEVAGLQALAMHHGGSLTINPKTGLPEAGFLSKILPILAGAALSFTGLGPLAAAGLMTAGGTIATGSLSKGLMMGLGAFGGAGLAGGVAKLGLGALAGEGAALSGAGAGAAAEAATANAASSSLPSSSALSNMAQAGTQAAGQAVRSTGSMAADAASQVGRNALTQTAQQPSFMGNMTQGFQNNLQAAGRGLPQAFQQPGQYMEAMGGPMNTAMYGAAAVAPFAVSPNMKYKMPNQETEEDKRSPLPRLAQDFYSRPMYSGQAVPITYPSRTFNAGGITSLGMYSDGGQTVIGPGDGMSDHVPATIAGSQPARLSTDEFVVPADVVSGIGNGSSRAGAARLYDMMDKVRTARTGNVQQAPQINSERMMPA